MAVPDKSYSQAWKTYPGAPAPGTRLAPATVMAGMELRSLAVGHGSDRFPILIVRWKDSFRAFVNACPHHYLPLDARSGHVLSACGKLLRCTNHDAAFRIADGVCVAGLAMGSSLDRIPLHIDLEGWLCIAETEA